MKISPKLIVAGASILTIAAVVTSITVFHHHSLNHQLKGASTSLAAYHATTKSNDAATTQATTTATNPTSPVSTTGSSATVTTASKKPASTPAPQPNTPMPVATVTPFPTPTPAPAPDPSFHITLHPENAHTSPVPFIPNTQQLIIPFDVILDDGFVPVYTSLPDCQFLVTPTTNSNVLCGTGMKDTGATLVVQYDDTSAPGHYEVEAIYTISGITRTDAVAFDLQ